MLRLLLREDNMAPALFMDSIYYRPQPDAALEEQVSKQNDVVETSNVWEIGVFPIDCIECDYVDEMIALEAVRRCYLKLRRNRVLFQLLHMSALFQLGLLFLTSGNPRGLSK